MSYDHEANILEQLHADITHLKEMGFIRGWFVEEHGERVHPLWYKGVDLFLYDAQANSYRINSGILTHKHYGFDLASYAELDKIKVVRRRCAFIDNLNTPCTRPALPGSPYCKRHTAALDHETPRLFYEKVRQLPGPAPEPAPNQGPGAPPAESEPAPAPHVIYASAPDDEDESATGPASPAPGGLGPEGPQPGGPAPGGDGGPGAKPAVATPAENDGKPVSGQVTGTVPAKPPETPDSPAG